MSALVSFAFEDHLVRVIDRAGDPWFVAKDVCLVLGISNHKDAVSRLGEDERDEVALTDRIGRKQCTAIISESGLYALVFASRKPAAKAFRKWVTAEILPAIRRTGQYAPAAPQPAPVSMRPDTLDQALAACREIRLTWGRTAARCYWVDSDLLDLYNPEADPDNLSDTPLALFLRDKCEVTGSREDFTRSRDLLAELLAYIEVNDLPRMGQREAANALRALSIAYRAPVTGARFWHHKRSDTGYCGIKLRA